MRTTGLWTASLNTAVLKLEAPVPTRLVFLCVAALYVLLSMSCPPDPAWRGFHRAN